MIINRAFDEVIDLLTSCPTPQAVLDFKPSAKMQKRASELLEKKRTESLSEGEKKELDHFMLLEHLMRLAKARARKRLAA